MPDFGPSRLEPAAGGVIVGARRPLIAFNVNLRGDVEAAREIAALVRERGGGFPGVRALGLDLPRRGLVQVSMNVEDWEASALHEIVARDRRGGEGARGGGGRLELVGLMPAGAAPRPPARLRIDGFDASHVLELRLLETDHASPTASAASPTSGTTHRRGAEEARAPTTANSGETKSSPVACAPRWTNEITPSTRPSTASGTSSCAAELSSTSESVSPAPVPIAAADGQRQRAGDAIRP